MSIIDNRKAFHDYFIEDKYEAGLVLQGWEVKAIRAGRANIKESYVVISRAFCNSNHPVSTIKYILSH